MNDTQHMIGRLVPDGVIDRDAVHVAVIPVEAAYLLLPGQRVYLTVDGKAAPCSEVKPVGIVDPFLQDVVQPGQRFWLFLLPNTVTGMTHHWRHPLFDGTDKLREHLTKKEKPIITVGVQDEK